MYQKSCHLADVQQESVDSGPLGTVGGYRESGISVEASAEIEVEQFVNSEGKPAQSGG